MKEPSLLLKVPLKWFPIQKDRLDFPSRVKRKKLVQGLSLDGHFDGLFSGSSKRLLNSTPASPGSRKNFVLKGVAAAIAMATCSFRGSEKGEEQPFCSIANYPLVGVRLVVAAAQGHPGSSLAV